MIKVGRNGSLIRISGATRVLQLDDTTFDFEFIESTYESVDTKLIQHIEKSKLNFHFAKITI